MNRIAKLALFYALPAALSAQNATVSSIRIGSDSVPWARFIVDGQPVTGMSTFMWAAGSKHTIQALNDIATGDACPASLFKAVQMSWNRESALLFTGWTDNTGHLLPSSDPIQTITADPGITSLVANFTLTYRVILTLFNAAPNTDPQFCQPPSGQGAPGPAPDQLRPGIVYIDGPAYWNSAVLYLTAGSHTLNAFPYPGFVFDGWSVNSGAPDTYIRTLNIQSPTTLAPHFEVAKRVRFLTNPMGLQVLVDRSPVPTVSYLNTGKADTCPSEFTLPPAPPPGILPLCFGDEEFRPNSTHVLGAPSPQSDIAGKVWVFDAWDRGGGQNTVYTADSSVSVMDVMTANFVRGAAVSLYTSPAGLPLNVDGRSNWPSSTFVWGLGSTHTVSALPSVTDSKGRKYTFQSWSNQGPATQQITVDDGTVTNGFRMTASYSVLSRLVVQTTPPGLTLQVDGSTCQSPCTVDKPNGSQVRVTAPQTSPIDDSSRLDFVAWTDGGAADHVVTVGADTQTIQASYQNMYRLAASSNPTNGATLQFSPSAPDMFFPSGQMVAVSAQANPGFKFRRWGGDLNGTYPSGQLSIIQPSSVIAQMDTVPYIAPAGVQNAAGPTPDQVVAPGSLISINGASLTSATLTGPVNPLAQTLGGVVVTMGPRMLPLLSVSPNVVTAQLPADLTDGVYTLTVSATGQPDVSATFTVARNAPGLFTWSTDSRPIALAAHADGTAVTPDSPAKQGETVTVYGTGFGPCQNPMIAGFLVPNAAPNPLIDTVVVELGDLSPLPSFSGAATDQIGMEITKFQITPDIPSGILDLKISVNGRNSNTVQLPVGQISAVPESPEAARRSRRR